MTPTPRFTGIFIPVEILEFEELSHLDQLLLSWIDALFCKDHGGCYASNEYLSKRLRVKENTIAKEIVKLRKLGLIEDVSFNGRNRVIKATMAKYVNDVQSNAALDCNPTLGLTRIQTCIGEKSNPVQIEKPLDSITTERKGYSRNSVAPSEEAFRLSQLLYEKMKINNPKTKQPNIESWAVHIDRMNRLDKYSWEEIEELIDFSQQDSFWRTNVLCTEKLRKQCQKLTLQLPKAKNNDNKEMKGWEI